MSRLAPESIAVLHHWRAAVKTAGFAGICSSSAWTAGIEAGKPYDSWHATIQVRPSL